VTSAPPENTSENRSERERVLVVDDDAAIRAGLSRVLQRGGFHVTTAEDGEEGLDRLLAGDFAAAIVDVAMP
jgi:CheY-like chemotaxis protein